MKAIEFYKEIEKEEIEFRKRTEKELQEEKNKNEENIKKENIHNEKQRENCKIILSSTVNVTEEQTKIFENEAEEICENLISFKSELNTTEISKNRDLCIKALKQDIDIDLKIQEIQSEISETESKILNINWQTYIKEPDFVKHKEPSIPEKRIFKKSKLFGGSIVDWRSKNEYRPIINTIGYFACSIFFSIFIAALFYFLVFKNYNQVLFVLKNGVENEINAMVVTFLIILVLVAIGFSIINYITQFFVIKLILNLIYLFLSVITYPIYCVINFVREKKLIKLMKVELKNYKEKVNIVLEKNKNEEELQKQKNEEFVKELNFSWANNANNRELETKELKLKIVKSKILLEKLIKQKTIAKENFAISNKYDNVEIKKELLSYLEQLLVYTLAEAIQYYELLNREKERDNADLEFKAMQTQLMNEDLRLRKEMAFRQQKALYDEARANEAHRKIVEKELKSIRRNNEINVEKQNQAIKEQQETLKKIEHQATSYGTLSNNEIDNIADKIAEKIK